MKCVVFAENDPAAYAVGPFVLDISAFWAVHVFSPPGRYKEDSGRENPSLIDRPE
jgi:hypothetical protein